MLLLSFVVGLAVYCTPAAIAAFASYRLARSSHEVWKVFVWIPVVPLALWGPRIAWDVARDPTSHNLWPFELVSLLLVSSVLYGTVLLARRLFGQPSEDWPATRRR